MEVSGGGGGMLVSLIVGVFKNEVVMNAGGDGRQCLVLQNQINISPDLIGFEVIKLFARYPKATNEEFMSTTVICDRISVARINQKTQCFVRFL